MSVLQTPKHQLEKLTTRWPDCTQDMSCHSSENWPQSNGNKCIFELQSNCIWTNQDDAGQTTDDQFGVHFWRWLCCFCMEHPSSTLSIKALTPGLSGEGNWPLDRCLQTTTHPHTSACIWNKANFPFHQLGLCIVSEHPDLQILLVTIFPLLFLMRNYRHSNFGPLYIMYNFFSRCFHDIFYFWLKKLFF